MTDSNNVENFTVKNVGRGGGSRGYRSTGGSRSTSVSRNNSRKSTPPIRRRPIYSGSHTLGRTGGVPFWGWSYYPWMTVSYPFYDYAEYPEFIEYAPVEEVKEVKEVKESKDINKKI